MPLSAVSSLSRPVASSAFTRVLNLPFCLSVSTTSMVLWVGFAGGGGEWCGWLVVVVGWSMRRGQGCATQEYHAQAPPAQKSYDRSETQQSPNSKRTSSRSRPGRGSSRHRP